MISHLPSGVRHPVQPFRYQEHTPSAAASRLVLSLWSFQADAAPAPDEPYTVFPDGCASIALVGPQSVVLVGPRVTAFRPPVSKGTRIWGIRFWPDAIQPVLGIEARSIRDYLGPAPAGAIARFAGVAAALPRSDDPDVVFPVLDEWVSRLLRDAPDPDPRIRAACTEIVRRRGEGSMEEVARASATGLRHLQRIFPGATGLTLREYARVRRLREALALRLTREAPNWSRIAAQAGFVDHAHLTREFVALTGTAPRAAAFQLATTTHRRVRP